MCTLVARFKVTLAMCVLLVSSCVVVSRRTPSEPGASEAISPPPSLSAAREYTSEPAPGAIRGGPLAADLARTVESHFAALNLTGDGRMAELAMRSAVETQRLRGTPSPGQIDFMARETGFAGPTPMIAVLPRVNGEWQNLVEALSTISRANIRFTHYGVAVVEFDGGIAGAVALGAQHLKLLPLPRHVAVDQRLRVSATPEEGYDKAEIVWTRPDGSTRRIPSGNQSTVEFETPPLERGVHRLEILAVGPSGLEVLANVPIGSGVELTPPVQALVAIDESDPKAALLALINRERQRAGAPALQQESSLDRVAEGHSHDMVDAHFFGHQSPTTGVVDDRLRAAGLRFGHFGENVARAASASEAHAMLLSSPGHRDNILSRRFTHVGIGVVVERAANPTLYAVTQVFAAFPRPIADTDGASASVFETLNRRRLETKGHPLVRAAALDSAARHIAQAVASDPAANPPEIAKPIIARRLAGTRHRHPLVLVAFPLDPTETATDARLHDAKFRSVGIAVAQAGSSAAPTANVVVVVLSK